MLTVTTILAGTTSFICDIEATADGDVTTGNVPHGMGVTPLDKSLCLLLVFAVANQPCWAFTFADATNIVCQKAATGGSGVANAQVRVRASLPHSIVR